MNNTLWMLCFLPLIILFLLHRQKKRWIKQHIVRKRRKGNNAMTQLIQEYIGKECLIYTMDSQITGTILAAEGNWITVNSGQEREIVNADFIVRIRPHPVTKKGKKKSVVLD